MSQAITLECNELSTSNKVHSVPKNYFFQSLLLSCDVIEQEYELYNCPYNIYTILECIVIVLTVLIV